MRTVADGVRLLLTALVLTAVAASFFPDAAPATMLMAAILLLGLVMIAFTLMGGMEAVIWIEVAQLGVYLVGAAAAAIVLAGKIPGGVSAALELGREHEKLRFFSFAFDPTATYTFWGGVIGGCFLTMSTHGTDQYLVQRYLCTEGPRPARRALLTSGAVVLIQFAGFLFIGLLLYTFYRPFESGYALTGDRVLPDFLAHHLPTPIAGLVVAAILAAALSSSLNAIAATALTDLYRPLVPGASDSHQLAVSRVFTLVAGLAQIGVAIAIRNQPRTALDFALSVASLLNGPVLGVFLLAALSKRAGTTAALGGMAAGLAAVLAVWLGTKVWWPWYAAIGATTAVVVGLAISATARSRRALAALAVLSLLLGSSCASLPKRSSDLTLDEKVGQLVVVMANGRFRNEDSPEWRELLRQVRENGVGGIVWSTSDPLEAAHDARRLLAASRIPLLFAADLETGTGWRFEDVTSYPSAMALGATGEPKLAERLARVQGEEARALGVGQVYAPVADVNVNPGNVVINTRSFGEDPEQVARFVAAFVRGSRGAGVLATVKHFPGHGDTAVNSHLALPVLAASRERIERVELVPFRAAIEAGVESVMVAHLAVPAVDATPAPPRAAAADADAGDSPAGGPPPTVPASVSEALIDGLLRRELGFSGLVLLDAVDMKGLTAHYEAGEACVRALLAGADVLLKPDDPDAVIAAVKAAVASGRIPRERLDAAVDRVLAAKRKYAAPPASDDEISRIVDREEHRALAAEVARRAVTLIRQENGDLPVPRDARLLHLVVSDRSDMRDGVELDRELRRRLTVPHETRLIDPRSTEAEIPLLVDAGSAADVVLVSIFVRTRAEADVLAMPAVARDVLSRLAEESGARRIVVAFGSPYALADVPALTTVLAAYGGQPIMQRAVAAALFGEEEIGGTLPVTIPGVAPIGTRVARAAEATQ
jgi:beta-glucosidase-like glycosyl hydrolase/Na+/proline symporter